MKTYDYGIPEDLIFVKVTGEDGVFYDLCRRFEIKNHIGLLKEGGYQAEQVSKKEVPPCQFRDFSDGLNSYVDAVWKSGTEFYQWGGKREGSGRPATGRKKKSFYITEEENEALREYLDRLRS